MKVVVPIGLVLIASCGRFGFSDQTPGADGGSGSGSNGDAAPLGVWRSVTTSGSSACAIKNDGSLWCWGESPTSTATYLPPAQIAGTWTMVSLAHSWAEHACGIQSDGSLWCWGSDAYGMLGDNNAGSTDQPRQIGTASWISVSVNGTYSCGVQSDHTLWCWGEDTVGQLGDNQTSGEQDVPAQVPGTTWASVTAGGNYACGLQTDGSLWCWGVDWNGALGNNTSENNAPPTQVPGTWLAVAASSADDHTCAIASDHGVWCWGQNSYGQLGTGDTSSSYVPVSIAVQATAIQVGAQHSCALLGDSSVSCWGLNDHGEMAAAPIGTQLTPVTIGSARSLSASAAQTCIVNTEDHVTCTGRDDLGQLGTVGATTGPVVTPTRSDTRTDWTAITAGGTHACGLTSNGYECWGLNSEGELGDGTLVDRQTPVAMMNATGVTAIMAGAHVTMGIKSDATQWLWGCDAVAISNDATGQQLVGTGWTGLAVGDDHGCGLQGTALTCRGDNAYGELGGGASGGTSNAVSVTGAWKLVAAGGYTTCAIDNSNALSCWGDNTFDQLANAAGGTMSSPQSIAITNPSWVGVSLTFACAIDGTGQLWCWGSNSCGQLGWNPGDANTYATPTKVGSRTDWLEITLGYRHVCAIPSDHTLWCWGHGGDGATGNPSLDDFYTPTQIGTDTDWAHVAAGTDFTCALKTDGTRWCMGSNADGQLGNGLAWNAGFVTIF